LTHPVNCDSNQQLLASLDFQQNLRFANRSQQINRKKMSLSQNRREQFFVNSICIHQMPRHHASGKAARDLQGLAEDGKRGAQGLGTCSCVGSLWLRAERNQVVIFVFRATETCCSPRLSLHRDLSPPPRRNWLSFSIIHGLHCQARLSYAQLHSPNTC
jgi:hypothetical protein